MQRTDFLDSLLENLGPDVETATKCVLTALAKKSDKMYEEVARDMRFITSQTKKMGAHSAVAMWDDANVNTRQQRKIVVSCIYNACAAADEEPSWFWTNA